ncbi:hypothetical protein T439DRAFT_326195 [Meredithblackwellia eburnea MCA 4105]
MVSSTAPQPPPELDLSDPALVLSWLEGSYHVVRLARSHPLPPAILSHLSPPPTSTEPSPSPPSAASFFFSITQTQAGETSVILPSPLFADLDAHSPSPPPGGGGSTSGGYAAEGPWCVLRVRGPMDLHLTGIMHALLGPLRETGVAIFASSTFDTDYVLVHEVDKGKTEGALRAAGWVWD